MWTVSNILSLSRLLLTIPIGALLVADNPGSRPLTVALILLAVLTDFLDGMIARQMHQVTELGKIVDPLADKIAVGVVSWILTVQGKLPLWYLVGILFRDGAILVGGVVLRRTRGIVLQSNDVGKWAVATIAILIFFTVLDIPGPGWIGTSLLWASTAFMILSFTLYLRRFFDVIREGGVVGGTS